MKKQETSHADINLAMMSFAIGQQNPEASIFSNMESIFKYVKSFNDWEKNHVLSYPNGWEDYTDKYGKDYEEIIYEWAKEYWL